MHQANFDKVTPGGEQDFIPVSTSVELHAKSDLYLKTSDNDYISFHN